MGYAHVFYFRVSGDANEFRSFLGRDCGFFSCSVLKTELLCPYPFKVCLETVQPLSPFMQRRLMGFPHVVMGFTNQVI